MTGDAAIGRTTGGTPEGARKGAPDRGTRGGAAGDAAQEPRNPFRRVWWLPVVRGVALVVLGLLLMIEPLEQLEILRLVLGAFLVLDGVLLAVQGLAHRRQVGSAWWLAQAAVNVLFGVAVALWPDLSETALYYVLAVWVLVLGITTIVGAAALARNRDLGWPWMLTLGIVSALFGLLLVTRPLDSLDVLRLVAIVFALFAFVAGAINVVSGFAVRAVARELADLRRQAEEAGVVVTGGSVLGAGAARPDVSPPAAHGPGQREAKGQRATPEQPRGEQSSGREPRGDQPAGARRPEEQGPRP